MDIPIGSKIHNAFHVSCLKNIIGHHISVSDTLPPLDDEGKLILIPNKILKTREIKLRRRTIKDYLVKWKDFHSEEAAWEDEQILWNPNLALLEDNQYWVGRISMSPSQ